MREEAAASHPERNRLLQDAGQPLRRVGALGAPLAAGPAERRRVDPDVVHAIAREIAALYPDGEWEVREFADPLTTQELSYRFTPLRYVTPEQRLKTSIRQ